MRKLLITIGVSATLAIGGLAGWRLWQAAAPRGLTAEYIYSLDEIRDSEVRGTPYREYARFATGMHAPTCLAVGPGDCIYVGGDAAVQVFDPRGARLARVTVGARPYCLAVAPDGRVWVGTSRAVTCVNTNGTAPERRIDLGPDARLTALALHKDELYMADAGQRLIWRYTVAGVLKGRIGVRDPARDIPGFRIPSPYFDLAFAPDGLLRAADSGRHHIEAYTPAGDLEMIWGQGSDRPEGFCGCCNPAYFTLLPDGSFVTSEKGLRRIKLFDHVGRYQGLIAGARELGEGSAPFPVRADSQGRLLLLDVEHALVRVYRKGP